MEYGKELLVSRISQVRDPVQKRLLQDVLVDVFGELLAYSEECYYNLEQKIDHERRDPDAQNAIYTGVCKKDGLDSASSCLFEIPKEYGEEDGHAPGYLGTLFLACDYVQIRGCMEKRFQAQVETDLGDYRTTVALSYSLAWQKTFSSLYQQFMNNLKQWHTINCPFLYKLLDITDQEGVVPRDAVVNRVAIDLGELSGCVMNDMALVWNLKQEVFQPKVDVAVAGHQSYYVHQIPVEERNAGYLALPEGEDLFSVILSENGLLVRTTKEAHPKLKIITIEPMNPEKDHTALTFPLQSNVRNLRHADRQAMGQPRFLWTKGEVERMLGAYEVFADFELEDIRPDLQGDVPALDFNPFIRVHSFLKQKRKMALILHAKDSQDIFRYEKLFFLLAELQLCTDEYEWTGILR